MSNSLPPMTTFLEDKEVVDKIHTLTLSELQQFLQRINHLYKQVPEYGESILNSNSQITHSLTHALLLISDEKNELMNLLPISIDEAIASKKRLKEMGEKLGYSFRVSDDYLPMLPLNETNHEDGFGEYLRDLGVDMEGPMSTSPRESHDTLLRSRDRLSRLLYSLISGIDNFADDRAKKELAAFVPEQQYTKTEILRIIQFLSEEEIASLPDEDQETILDLLSGFDD